MSENSRLRWLCRRGMKEHDLLLGGYLEKNYANAPEAEQNAFKAILEMPDPELNDLILGRFESDDAEIGKLILFLRNTNIR